MFVILAWLLGLSPPNSTMATVPAGWVRAWTDRDTPYNRGDRVQVFFQVDQPAYVTALRVDTDGRVRVLFPETPWADNKVRARRTLEITARQEAAAFTVDDPTGIGYVLLVASPVPFDYGDITRGDYWDYRLIRNGRIRGDPYVALTDLAERIAPRGRYDYDIVPYHVGRRYDYPRFVCAQCHAPPRDEKWDEYRLECARFRLVIHDDPAYYSYRHSGRRAVITRPLHPGPRFVFRDAAPGVGYVTRRRGLPEAADRRRAQDLSPARPLVERHPGAAQERPRRRPSPSPR